MSASLMRLQGSGLRAVALLATLLIVAEISGCAGERAHPPPASLSPADARQQIDRTVPMSVPDRAGWTADLYAGFTALGVPPTAQNVCAVVAVIEQESGFSVDPWVPGLSVVAWREIDDRAAHAGLPKAIVHGILEVPSPTGQSYAKRIDGAHTEKQLSDIYEDLITSVPLGRTLFEDHNPIRTRGPMQVHVKFAEKFAADTRYPYPVTRSIADEVFTRRGGLYFGIAHLFDYEAPYDRYLYRFADFNAGQFASRNAAFQRAVAVASGRSIVADGALLPHDDDPGSPGATELAVRALGPRIRLGDAAIHASLEQGKTAEFAKTLLYKRVFATASESAHRDLPQAVLPQIELHGPKISRKLTTAWYANRVDERFNRCLQATRRSPTAAR